MRHVISWTLLIMSLAFVSAQAAELRVSRVAASGHEAGNPPAHTLDKNFSTRWSAKGAGSSIVYELDICHTIGSVAIAWHKGDERTAAYILEVSQDGDTWEAMANGESSGITSGLESIHMFTPVVCFVRLIGMGNSQNDWVSVSEMQIFTEFTDPPVTYRSTEITANRSEPGRLATHAIDGDINTYWAGKGHGATITLYLGEQEVVFNEVMIAWYRGGQRSAKFVIDVSWYGDQWLRVYSGYSSGQTADLETYGFAPINANYVRIMGMGNSQNDWNSIAEIQVVETPVEYPAMP